MIVIERAVQTQLRRWKGEPQLQRSPISNSGSKKILKSRKSRPGWLRIMDFLMDILTTYIYYDTRDRAKFYFYSSAVFAFMGRLLAPLPEFYLTKKRNLLNDLLVKWSLAWTSGLLFAFIFLTAFVYSRRNILNVARQSSRLFVLFLVWYLITRVLANVEDRTGICSIRSMMNDRKHDNTTLMDFFYNFHSTAVSQRGRECLRAGGSWFAFEISGHCFLLVYCALVIAQELRVFRNWSLIPIALRRRENQEMVENDRLMSDYNRCSKFVEILFAMASFLVLIWDVMFVITILYYHTWTEQLIGLLIGIASWYTTYELWYRTNFSPRMPGDSGLMNEIEKKRKMRLIQNGL